MTRTLLTVPMKAPSASKTRLAACLSHAERIDLVCLLYQRTLQFLERARPRLKADLSVVTRSAVAADMARAHGCCVIDEPRGADLSGAVSCAADYATAAGYDRLCVLPADLGTPEVDDLVDLLQSPAAVAICPSEDHGTNALVVSPPHAIAFRYGAHSAQRHLVEARSRGLSVDLKPLNSLAYDIDTAVCLDRARVCVPGVAQLCP
ncbi:MAG: 2-phospho-L-lactate guanylyltransferase [Pseudomonadota bacterium]